MTKHIHYLILNQKINFCCNENMRKCPPTDALWVGRPGPALSDCTIGASHPPVLGGWRSGDQEGTRRGSPIGNTSLPG